MTAQRSRHKFPSRIGFTRITNIMLRYKIGASDTDATAISRIGGHIVGSSGGLYSMSCCGRKALPRSMPGTRILVSCHAHRTWCLGGWGLQRKTRRSLRQLRQTPVPRSLRRACSAPDGQAGQFQQNHPTQDQSPVGRWHMIIS